MIAPAASAQSNEAMEAQIAALMAQIAALQAQSGGSASASMMFTRDLTIGASGADVTALQNWLIKGGYAIPGGATGYFGAQTAAALARYQAANSISPAAGYFGPITRSRIINSVPAVPVPGTTNPNVPGSNNEDDSTDREDAEESITEIKEELEDVRERFDDEKDNGNRNDIEDIEELLDRSSDLIDDAENAFGDRDYDGAIDYAAEAEDVIDNARDEIDSLDNDRSDDDDSDRSKVTTSARTNTADGPDNDSATFRIAFDLNSFGDDTYIDRDPEISLDFAVIDGDGDEVTGASTLSASIDSSADEDGDYFRINEGDREEFELIVVFDPLPSGEGEAYRLRLDGVRYNDREADPDSTFSTRSRNDYRTDLAFIAD